MAPGWLPSVHDSADRALLPSVVLDDALSFGSKSHGARAGVRCAARSARRDAGGQVRVRGVTQATPASGVAAGAASR